MFDLELLSAGLSAVMGVKVIPPSPHLGDSVPTLNLDDFVALVTHNTKVLPLEKTERGKPFEIFVKTMGGRMTSILARHDSTIESIKAAVGEKENTAAIDQKLLFNGMVLSDHQTVESIGIPAGGTFLNVGQDNDKIHFQLDSSYLDPGYDYDYTNIKDDGTEYYRGYKWKDGVKTDEMFVYKKPYGWYRYALNVLGKYEDDSWLVSPTNGDWPSAYHGTNMSAAMSIVKEGFIIGSGHVYGYGVYTAVEVEAAKQYSTKFSHNGHEHYIVLQNRINPKPDHLKVVESVGYYVSPLQNILKGVYDVRPYGILISKAV